MASEIRIPVAPRDPRSRGELHDRIERGDETADRARYDDAVPVGLVRVRLAVADDHQFPALEHAVQLLQAPLFNHHSAHLP